MPRFFRKPSQLRITDQINFGALADCIPRTTVETILEQTARASKRHRQLPAHVVVYYVVALALYSHVAYREVLRCLLAGLRLFATGAERIPMTSKSGISQARQRLGAEPLRQLQHELVRPIATPQTQGAWYRGWRLVSIDGSTLDVADTPQNEEAFGRPGASRGRSGFPQIRFVSLLENGTHVLFGTHLGSVRTGENTLAKSVLNSLTEDMLCLADRGFLSYDAWMRARESRADLVWRVKKDRIFACHQPLPDGSYLSAIYPSARHRERGENGIPVRVITYRLEGLPDSQPVYRLITSILDPREAPAVELAALYHERWEIETALGEFKTHLRGRKIVLRSKTPELVRQEFYGLLLAYFAVRGLMHEAALEGDVDPDVLSFVHAVRVIRRKLPQFAAIRAQLRQHFHRALVQEILDERVDSSRGRQNPRAVKKNVGKFPIRPRRAGPKRCRYKLRIVVAG